jgi:hypothetical protein
MRKILLAGAACLLSLATAQAAPVLLDSNPTLSVGELTFTNFSCSSNSSGLSGGGCGGLNVDTLASGGISITGGLSAVAPVSGPQGELDLVVRYQVTSSGTPITGVGLGFNGSVSGPGTAFAEIIEQAFADDARTDLLGSANVSTADGTSVNTLTFSRAVATAYLEKDILLNAFAPGITTATISIINQPINTTTPTPTPTPTPVPEPASLALFGAGLLGLGAVRRRRRAKAA